MNARGMFVINCLLFALLAFVLAANWWITLNELGLPIPAWLASGLGVALGLFALLMGLSAALGKDAPD